jgi:DNA-directed RNA polymerase specialized sigma24 family protein
VPSGGDLTDLIISAQAGDQRAWDALVERFSPFVWAVARGHGLTRAAAADVAQTSWLRLLENLDHVSRTTLGTWLARSTRAEAVQALLWSDPRPERRSRAVDDLWEIVDALPARTRLALRVIATEPPPSKEEIGASLDVPPEEVDELVRSSLRKLAEAIPSPSTI